MGLGAHAPCLLRMLISVIKIWHFGWHFIDMILLAEVPMCSFNLLEKDGNSNSSKLMKNATN